MRVLVVIPLVLVAACQTEKPGDKKAGDPAAPAPVDPPIADRPHVPVPNPPAPTPTAPDPSAPAPTPTPSPAGVTPAYKQAITDLCNVVDTAKRDPAWRDDDQAATARLITKYTNQAKAAATDPEAKKDFAALDRMPDINRLVPVLESLATKVGLASCPFTVYLRDTMAKAASKGKPPAPP